MPLIDPSAYRAPWGLRNGHVQTVVPVLFRRVPSMGYVRERLELSDGDFLDLDWSRSGASRVVIISHGLEGSTDSGYVRGMGLAFQRRGWDVLAWNFRGCGGEPNRLPRFYHSGATEDLGFVIQKALSEDKYQEIALVGFSLGGNMMLKYLGEQAEKIHERIVGGVAISVPCDLGGSSEVMARWYNRIYMERFMRCLRKKVRLKMDRFPGLIHDEGLDGMRTFHEFDEAYTAPLHGFESARDYWDRCSGLAFLEHVRCPVLLINAADDPFLSDQCYPRDLARQHRWFHLEIPHTGGHVGFVTQGMPGGEYWTEGRAVEFLEDHEEGARSSK